MVEQWRTVVYENEVFDNYEVSDWGNVRSLNYGRTRQIKMLKQYQKNNGYLVVSLSKNGKVRQLQTHRIVAFTWIPNDDVEHKTQVNHIDENKLNNHVDNLEWISHKNNLSHGTCQKRRAEKRSKRVKCVETGIIYDSCNDVERKTGLNHGEISKACRGLRETVGNYHWEFVDYSGN